MDEQSQPAARAKIRVKSLVWTRHREGTDDETFTAESVLGKYAAWKSGGQGYFNAPDTVSRVQAGADAETAMAAAQARFENAILSVVEIA